MGESELENRCKSVSFLTNTLKLLWSKNCSLFFGAPVFESPTFPPTFPDHNKTSFDSENTLLVSETVEEHKRRGTAKHPVPNIVFVASLWTATFRKIG